MRNMKVANYGKSDVKLHPFVSDEMYGLLKDYTEAKRFGVDYCTLIDSHGLADEAKITIFEAEGIIYKSLTDYTKKWSIKIPDNDRHDFVYDTSSLFFVKSDSNYMYDYCHSEIRDNNPFARAGYMNKFFSSCVYDYFRRTQKYRLMKDTISGNKLKIEYISLDDTESESYESLQAESEAILRELRGDGGMFDTLYGVEVDDKDRRVIMIEALKEFFSEVSGSPDKVLVGAIKIAIQALVKETNGAIADFFVDGDVAHGALWYINDKTPRQIVSDFSNIINEISGGDILLGSEDVDYIFSNFKKKLDKVDKKSGKIVGDIVCNFTVTGATNDCHRINGRRDKVFDRKKREEIVSICHSDIVTDDCHLSTNK